MRAEDVIEFRWARHRGATLKELAKKYGISQGHLSKVATGIHYPNIGGPLTAQRSQDHCIRGHEYTPENTIMTHGRRNCRRCKNDLDNARRKQKRAEARNQPPAADN